MISSTSNGYYDLVHNRMTVRGFSHSDNAEDAKILVYSNVISNIYCITVYGKIYSIPDNRYISWSIKNRLPYVNLSRINSDGYHSLEPYYIKDLMAYNYIANADDYIERGCHAAYVDGDPMNCRFDNIRYIGPLQL